MPLLGSLLVLVFTLSQSVRDVYFGSVFQRFDFFQIILLAFSWSTVIFATTTLIRAPSDIAKLRAQSGPIVAVQCYDRHRLDELFLCADPYRSGDL